MSTNGEMEEHLDERQQRQIENRGLEAAKSEAVADLTNHINSICDTDVSPVEDCGLEDYLSRDFVMAYFEDADIEKLQWQVYIAIEMILIDAPEESDEIKGDEEMEYIFGVNSDEVRTEPFNQTEKQALEAARAAIHARTTRSKGMKQQDMLTKTTNESVVRRPDTESGGGLLSFIRG